jgi:hypothetical protein
MHDLVTAPHTDAFDALVTVIRSTDIATARHTAGFEAVRLHHRIPMRQLLEASVRQEVK